MNDSTKTQKPEKPGKPKPAAKKPVGRAKHVSVPPSAPTENVSAAIPAAAAALKAPSKAAGKPRPAKAPRTPSVPPPSPVAAPADGETPAEAAPKRSARLAKDQPAVIQKPLTVLVTGVSGTLARGVAQRLVARGHVVHGMDRRPWPDAPDGIEMHQADIRKRPAEDVFRTARPDVLVHMATVTHFTTGSDERYRINLGGTRRLFEHCHEYGVKQALFVGRHTVYGATADSPLYHTEDEPPLGGASFRELADLVAADLYAGSALWRWPQLSTAVLRLCYFLGPSRRGTLANFLGDDRVALVMGFDPLFQFMHEFDAEEAIILAIEKKLRGVYNVAGPPPVPLSILCRATGRRAVLVPEFLYGRMLGRVGLSFLPGDAVAHIKYPIVVNSEPFKQATGFEPKYDSAQTMEGFRWS
jgi:UDP-glucose 4-epimerase